MRNGLRALNDGIIWSLYLESQEKSIEYISEYLSQSHASLLRIGECLSHTIQNDSLITPISISVDIISWIEVPLE